MSFFSKLFGSKETPPPVKNPDNTRLVFLMDNYSQHKSDQNNELVFNELRNGNCFLMVPTIPGENISNGWTTLDKDSIINVSSIFDLDGLKVLAVFTDEPSLSRWVKEPTPYISLKAKDVLVVAEELKINRIVINSDSPNMYVLAQDRNLQNIPGEEERQVKIGPLSQPIPEKISNRIIVNFSSIENVIAAYQYGQMFNDDFSVVIGIQLSVYSDNAKEAAVYAITGALKGESAETKIEIQFLEGDGHLKAVSDIEGSAFYLREQMGRQ